jgi:hypothetical protein
MKFREKAGVHTETEILFSSGGLHSSMASVDSARFQVLTQAVQASRQLPPPKDTTTTFGIYFNYFYLDANTKKTD